MDRFRRYPQAKICLNTRISRLLVEIRKYQNFPINPPRMSLESIFKMRGDLKIEGKSRPTVKNECPHCE